VEAIEERTPAQGSISMDREVVPSTAESPAPGPSVERALGELPGPSVLRAQDDEPAAPVRPPLVEGAGGASGVGRDLDALYPEWSFG
jgi:hypothetical protein